MNTVATGARTGFDFNLLSSVGYQFELPRYILFTPSYCLDFTTFYDPQYTETGATNGANLIVGERTTFSLLQTISFKVVKVFKISVSLSFLPEVWGGWEHEYLNTGGAVTNAFAASPTQSWTSDVSTIANDRAIFGKYDQKILDKGFITSFSAGLKISF